MNAVQKTREPFQESGRTKDKATRIQKNREAALKARSQHQYSECVAHSKQRRDTAHLIPAIPAFSEAAISSIQPSIPEPHIDLALLLAELDFVSEHEFAQAINDGYLGRMLNGGIKRLDKATQPLQSLTGFSSKGLRVFNDCARNTATKDKALIAYVLIELGFLTPEQLEKSIDRGTEKQLLDNKQAALAKWLGGPEQHHFGVSLNPSVAIEEEAEHHYVELGVYEPFAIDLQCWSKLPMPLQHLFLAVQRTLPPFFMFDTDGYFESTRSEARDELVCAIDGGASIPSIIDNFGDYFCLADYVECQLDAFEGDREQVATNLQDLYDEAKAIDSVQKRKALGRENPRHWAIQLFKEIRINYREHLGTPVYKLLRKIFLASNKVKDLGGEYATQLEEYDEAVPAHDCIWLLNVGDSQDAEDIHSQVMHGGWLPCSMFDMPVEAMPQFLSDCRQVRIIIGYLIAFTNSCEASCGSAPSA